MTNSAFRVVALAMVVALVLSSPADARRNRNFKVPSGPSENFGRRANAKDIHHYSSYAAVRLSGGGAQSASFNTDGGIMDISVIDSDGSSQASVQLPGDAGPNSMRDFNGDRGQFIHDNSETGYDAQRVLTHNEAAPGQVKVNVDSVAGDSGVVVLVRSRSSKINLDVQRTSLTALANSPVELLASLVNAQGNNNVIRNGLESATATITSEGDDAAMTVEFEATETAGVLSASFTPSAAGVYTVAIDASGSAPNGAAVDRSEWLSIHVSEDKIAAISSASMSLTHELGMEVSIKAVLDAPGLNDGDIVHLRADITGSLPSGRRAPVATVSAMCEYDAEAQDCEIVVQPDWFWRASVSAPFYLNDVSLSDPDTWNAYETAEEIAVDADFNKVPGKPGKGNRLESLAKSTEEDHVRLTQGVRPMKTQSGVHKRILVHGYCSGDVWGHALSNNHFSQSSTVKFQDYDKNRSHNQFALNIRTFGEGSGFGNGQALHGCGLIGHSQGGAASLHLYTYYWSCLDYGSYGGSRYIQSVGTPYQGTNLAGILAAMGNWFGIGCGQTNDMTYSGAASWLSGIPSWARSQVYYRTTSFTDRWWAYDYCQIVTDVVLSDPDDGTVEKSKGQLSGGNNLGHKTGWCHTTSMRDPPQTRDSSWNSNFNSNSRY
jgi:hypothetical protein